MNHPDTRTRFTRPFALVVTAVAAAGILAGCSSDPAPDATAAAGGISAERCAENEAAGTITYLSGYQYQSSASILEYVAAEALGYFDEMCLDVVLQPGSGDTAQNTKLLASGQASISAIAQQDVIQAQANGIDIIGVSSYSNAGLDILMTNPDITALDQLNGTVVGHKGYMPASVRAMMEAEGVDWDSLTLVQEGYDPTVLTRRQDDLSALTGFISNEPNQLAAAGEDITVWQPIDYGIPSSLGAMAVNPAFAAEHPTAVEDVLRGAIHALEYCSTDPDTIAECVGYAADLSGATYDSDLNEVIWATEVDVIQAHPYDAMPLGSIDPANIAALTDMLRNYGIISDTITDAEAESWFDDSYIAAIYDGDTLIWPAP